MEPQYIEGGPEGLRLGYWKQIKTLDLFRLLLLEMLYRGRERKYNITEEVTITLENVFIIPAFEDLEPRLRDGVSMSDLI